MSIHEREDRYISILSDGELTVKELADKLFISEPTVRRDILIMEKKDIVNRRRGVVSLRINSADKRIPLFIRDMENQKEKREIAIKAVSYIKDGDSVFLDASTTAFCLIPYLTDFKNLFVITNGAKTALELASLGIKTVCTGGELTFESFSYIGPDAEDVLRRYNANLAFFSCRGISDDGVATDNSILENSMRKIMIKNSERSFLLCDKSKFGQKHLNTLCHTKELEAVICNV